MICVGFCRLCAEIKNTTALVVINKNENDSTTDIGSKVLQCFQIQILSDDLLPKTVCLECCAQTNMYYEFYLQVQKAQEFLQNIVCNPTVTDSNSGTHLDSTNSICVNKINIDSQNKSELNPDIEIPECTDTENCPSPINSKNIEITETNSTLDDENDANDHIKREEYNEEDFEVKISKRLGKVWKDIWNCTKCSSEFKTNKDLVEHSQNEHADSPEYKCPRCSKLYIKYRTFVDHVKGHVDKDKYRCDICAKTFNYKKNLRVHLNNYHKQGPQFKKTCDICGKEFINPGGFRYHTKYFHKPLEDKLRFECDICKKRVTTKSSLLSHRKIHDDSTKFNICERCGAGFHERTALKIHIQRVHTQISEENYLSCSLCPAKLKHRIDLRRHIRETHSKKRFECETCGKQFYVLAHYREHLRKHTGERPFECQHCNKRFRLKGDLEIHSRQHTGEKPYCCTDCKHYFTDFSNYIKHMKRKHGVTSFKNLRNPKNKIMNMIF